LNTVRAVIGRTHELESISTWLDAGGALCLAGDAGIGKTTVWRAGVELARERGFRVLAAEPVEAERSLSYAVLADLLEPITADVLSSLPEPQRRALERVLLLAEDDAPLDARLVGAAVRTSLEALGGPVLVAIDDVQWLDAASAAALAFALRRSPSPRALIALRAGHELPLRIEAEVLEVGPLSVGALHHLLVQRLGVALQRSMLLRLHELSGGNPFYALELARANPDGRDIVLPPSLQHVVADRLGALPAETRRSLAALALGGEADELGPAVDAGIVERVDGRFRFAHPLFAEAATTLVPEPELRDLHAAIAEQTSDPELRARHLAHSAAGPDEQASAALEEAAQAAAYRGAFAAAAELWELAAKVTQPEHEEYPRRLVEAGIAHVIAGNPDVGGALLEPNLERLPPGPLRQRGFVHLALRLGREDVWRVVPVLERALAEAEEPRLRYEVTLLLASSFQQADEREHAEEVAREHLRYAEQQDDPAVLEDALLLAASQRLASDRPAWDLLDRAREIAAARDGDRPRRAWGWAPLTAAYVRDGRLADARAALEEARAEAVRAGSASYDLGLLLNLSIVELAAGKSRLAYELADEALTVAEQTGEPSQLCIALVCAAHAAVVLGEVDVARRHGERALELARRVHAVLPGYGVSLALGSLELSLGRTDAAAEIYRTMTPYALARFNNVAGGRGQLDAVEALAAVGDLERAAEIASGLPDDAREKPPAEACVAAARGDLARAIELVEAAEPSPSPSPFRRAREQLLLGRLLRRARRKRDARAALETARDAFLALEAPLWAERAADELARLGGRSPVGATLTDSERRVAELVASGLSNKEVAARLVVTVRTVEWHLSKIYEKLGVTSRTALAARWPDEEQAKTGGFRSTA
jgi:DNA-binding CsgD family transcriptional regulator